MADVSSSAKARGWVAVLYVENMPVDWEDTLSEKLQLPYCYVVHDKDTDSDGALAKVHVHLMCMWPSPTTYKNALRLFSSLSADGLKAVNTCEQIHNVRFMYDYLLHDTDNCRKKKKYPYYLDGRKQICGNGFDIHFYEQVSIEDKDRMFKELSKLIITYPFVNYVDFQDFVLENYNYNYLEVMKGSSAHFRECCRGMYLKYYNDRYQREILLAEESEKRCNEEVKEDDKQLSDPTMHNEKNV